MARARSPNRDKAFQMWEESGGKLKLKEIAEQLGVSDSQIRKWKNVDKWDEKLKGNVTIPNSNVTNEPSKPKNRGGAPKGNTNAKGNRGGKGAPLGSKNAADNKGGKPPLGNQNATKHGLYAKILPEESLSLLEEIEVRSPLEIMWDNIMYQYLAIVRAQKLMYVRDQHDIVKEPKRTRMGDGLPVEDQEYEIQFAWDRHAAFMAAQSRAVATLTWLIDRYEAMVSDEQRLKVEKLKADIERIRVDKNNGKKALDFADLLVETWEQMNYE